MRAGSAGMTLLELLLALTVMASVMGLLGTLMGQARSWTQRGATDQVLMRLQRVGEAMRAQWADRRTAVDLDEEGRKVAATASSLRFLTATGMLFPEWPLVVAEYRIEADTQHFSSGGVLWRLVYEETRLSGMEEIPGAYAVDVRGRPMREAMVLLEACPELWWERFGRGTDADGIRGAGRRGTEGGGRAVDGGGSDAPEDARGAESGARGAGEEERAYRWRPLEEGFEGFVPAVRLVGAHEGERFGWVFVVKALR